MKCGTCEFWTPPRAEEREPVRARMGICARAPHVEDMTEWNADFSERTILPEYSDRTAATSDASGYSSKLLTAPDHFCTMFRAADANHKGETS